MKIIRFIVGIAVLIAFGIGWLVLWNDNTKEVVSKPPPSRPPIADGPTAPPVQTIPQPSMFTDADYVAAVEKELGIDYDDQYLINIGRNACAVIAEYGLDPYLQNIQVFADNMQMSAKNLFVITTAAVLTYCPTYV